MTVSLNVIAMANVSPILYIPSVLDEETVYTIGAIPSITNALLAPNDPVDPGVCKVKSATFPAASVIVPLFKAKAVVIV